MLALDRLKKELVTTQANIDNILTKDLRALMSQTPNVGFSVSSQYAFQCVCCESIGFPSFYKLIKKQVGPLSYSRETDPKMLNSTKGIVRLDELACEPEFSSTLNFTEDGLVCDHCYDTVYSGD
jgi:hypothetical protein